jgi:DNA-binding MarR family transcriptional regulator
MKLKSIGRNDHRKGTSKRAEVSAEGLKMLNLDLQLCFALYATSRAMTNAYRPILKDIDLTYPQYLVMLVLWQQSNISIGALGERLHLDSGTLTPLLKRLESRGLIRRRRDPTDERQVLVTLTPAGEAMRKPASFVPVELKCRIDLPRGKAKQLNCELRMLLDRLMELGVASS